MALQKFHLGFLQANQLVLRLCLRVVCQLQDQRRCPPELLANIQLLGPQLYQYHLQLECHPFYLLISLQFILQRLPPHDHRFPPPPYQLEDRLQSLRLDLLEPHRKPPHFSLPKYHRYYQQDCRLKLPQTDHQEPQL